MRRRWWIALLLCLGGLVACRGKEMAPGAGSEADKEAIRALVAAHREAVLQRDAQRLLELWAADGVITDANHTPANPGDDRVWAGHEALLAYYTTLVFPLYLDDIGPADVEVYLQGDTAWATATTRIGQETSPGGERWTFIREGGKWRIASITFNLEP